MVQGPDSLEVLIVQRANCAVAAVRGADPLLFAPGRDRRIGIPECVLTWKIELKTQIQIGTPSRVRWAVHGSPCREQQDDLASELRSRAKICEDLGDVAWYLLGMKLAQQLESFGYAAFRRYAEYPVV